MAEPMTHIDDLRWLCEHGASEGIRRQARADVRACEHNGVDSITKVPGYDRSAWLNQGARVYSPTLADRRGYTRNANAPYCSKCRGPHVYKHGKR